ncbi:helix-turn-helix domain-containing protein [Parasphingorhabdus pacifica]
MAPTSPAVANWKLGCRLRKKREQLRLTGTAAAKNARIAKTYLSDVERGIKPPARERLDGLISAYGMSSVEADELRQLREQATEQGWWSRYAALYSDELLRFFGYEYGAESIRTYDGGLIHGLLQTEEYARAIIQAGSPNVRLAEASRRVESRVMRQERLTGDDPLRLSVVMSEAAIRQEVGGPGVLAAQLDHVLDVAQRQAKNLDVRVIPFSAMGHHAMGGSTFHVVTFPDEVEPALVWQETVTSTGLIVDPVQVGEYCLALDEATKSALDRDESFALIKSARNSLE